MKWFYERMRALLEVVHSPEVVFARDFRGASFLVPFGVLGIFFVSLYLVQLPLQAQWAQLRLEASGAPLEQVAASLEIMRKMSRFGAAMVPLLLLLRWALYALLLWLTSQLFLQALEFSRLLSIVAYGYVPILVRDGVICLVLLLRGDGATASRAGMEVALGLNLLFPQIPMPWANLAGNINLFELWFVTILVMGIATSTKSRWQKALAIVLPTWLFVLLLQLGAASLAGALSGAASL